MKVVILAGGFGTRISEESHLRPKPMIEIGGAPIIWHIMKYYAHFGFKEFIICCGYKGYVIKEYFAAYYLHHSDVTFDFANKNEMVVHNNAAEPWKVTVVDTGYDTQTGGRIRRVKRYVGDETVMLTYGDGVGDIDLRALLAQHRESGKLLTLSAVQPVGRFGVLDIDDTGRGVSGFQEKAKQEGGWINIGFMVLEPEFFAYLEGDDTILERAPMERLSAEGKMGVYKHYGYWQCMDTQRDKMVLEERLEQGNAPWKVWENGD